VWSVSEVVQAVLFAASASHAVLLVLVLGVV
jgi:hypothetical protein